MTPAAMIGRSMERMAGAAEAPVMDDRLAWINLPDPAFNLCDYHAGHTCRRCLASITDREYIDAGLFLSLCSSCLASARQTMRVSS